MSLDFFAFFVEDRELELAVRISNVTTEQFQVNGEMVLAINDTAVIVTPNAIQGGNLNAPLCLVAVVARTEVRRLQHFLVIK